MSDYDKYRLVAQRDVIQRLYDAVREYLDFITQNLESALNDLNYIQDPIHLQQQQLEIDDLLSHGRHLLDLMEEAEESFGIRHRVVAGESVYEEGDEEDIEDDLEWEDLEH